MSEVKISREELKGSVRRIEEERCGIDQYMIGNLPDARRRIAEAWKLKMEAIQHVAAPNPERSSKEHKDDDWNDEEKKLVQQFNLWQKECERLEWNIALEIAYWCFTPDDVAWQKGLDVRHVIGYYIRGLEKWDKLFHKKPLH
jgi:hypothetical protein